MWSKQDTYYVKWKTSGITTYIKIFSSLLFIELELNSLPEEFIMGFTLSIKLSKKISERIWDWKSPELKQDKIGRPSALLLEAVCLYIRGQKRAEVPEAVKVVDTSVASSASYYKHSKRKSFAIRCFNVMYWEDLTQQRL